MARIFSLIVLLIVLVFGASFAALNAGLVPLDFYYGSIQLPLSLVLVFSLVSGVLLGLMAALGKIIVLKREIKKLRRDVRNTEKEVTNLRALPIKDSK